jgi:hypothetical protein
MMKPKGPRGMRTRISHLWILMAVGLMPGYGILLAEDVNSGSNDHITQRNLAIGAGSRFGLEASAGLHGSLSFFELGALWPLKDGKMFLGLRTKSMSSITWATFVDLEDGETASFHPVVVGGAFTVGGASPLVHGFLKAHGYPAGLFLHTL